MISINAPTIAGEVQPVLDPNLSRLLELTDQLGHYAEYRCAEALLAFMDRSGRIELTTGASLAIPHGHETNTGLISLVALMPNRLFIRGRAPGTFRLTRTAIANYLAGHLSADVDARQLAQTVIAALAAPDGPRT
ncbi:hypothetical protein [Mycobacteroides abscessus]|uniref:hypothetical protein n=1 Tax=Mycobacteroides abscessus TaxID=36809 RepID=UPI00092674DB|nr:hypothetical protein [Mycobacteroides abscessus]SIC19734.1 Uncharacterised protein [Mycobacteroides abscessus subsp. abscessus]